MTPTERAKRSDALYYETVSVNRRVLCDMVANREADLEDAQAKNAKLRELVADAMAALRVAEDELGRDVMVAHYPLLHIRMRELGVEE